jgi:hypothetical protein
MTKLGSSTEIPSIQHLHTLSLTQCQSITTLESMPTLKSLILLDCDNLTCVGPLGNLQTLYLRDRSDKYRYSEDNLISRFPLEQLTNLFLVGDYHGQFERNLHRLLSLKSLTLRRTADHELVDLSDLNSISSLDSLVLIGFRSFNLTGLLKLKSLDYFPTVNYNIEGLEQIFPQLQQLNCSDYLNGQFQTSHLKSLGYCYRTQAIRPKEMINVSSFSIYEHWTTPLKEELVIREKMQSLE